MDRRQCLGAFALKTQTQEADLCPLRRGPTSLHHTSLHHTKWKGLAQAPVSSTSVSSTLRTVSGTCWALGKLLLYEQAILRP